MASRLLSRASALLLAWAVIASPAFAQGVDYAVRIDAPGALEELLEDNLDLMRWRGNARVDMDQLQRMVKEAPEQARKLIATEGYYSPRISAGLDTSGGQPVARILVEPGEPVLVGEVELEFQGFAPFDANARPYDTAALRQRWALPAGARFRQADWEGAKRALLREVSQARYPRARLKESRAIVDPEARRALLRVVIDSGPEMRFGELRIRGLRRYPPEILTNLNKIKPGDEYSESAMQALQARLQETGYFTAVEVSVDMRAILNAEIEDLKDGEEPADANETVVSTTLPLVVRVSENKRKKVEAGVGFSTDTGARARLSYDDLNVLGKRFNSDIIYEQRRQSALTELHWPTNPKGHNDSIGAKLEREDLRGEITTLASLSARRTWGTPLQERSLTIEALTEKREVLGLPTTRSRSLPLTYSVTWRRVDNLIQPTRGYVLNAQAGGALTPLLTDERFLRGYARGIYYKPVGAQGTVVLRGELGAVTSKNKIGVPSTFLFRAGGDQSVRGYGYQALGVQENGAIVGGRYLATASAEYQYWFKPPWGVAVFYDVGNAADTLGSLHPKSGYGIGARWRSPVGPINVDLAYGHAAREARLHFSLGFTF